jgi:predicted ATPase
MKNNWYVITGGPSVGKTTLLSELEKLGHTTLPEAARIIIDQAIAKGQTLAELRADEERFQKDILKLKIKIEKTHPPELLTFFDRGMHDTLAYFKLHGFRLDKSTVQAMERFSYKKVFLLEPLAIYKNDYARTESAAQANRLNQLLHKVYTDHGMEPVVVPVLPVDERAQFVLSRI